MTKVEHKFELWLTTDTPYLTLLGELWLECFDGLVQERRNSSALAMELRLSCTDP